MLTGAGLSVVQETGVQILMMLGQKERSKAFFDDLRSRIAANNPSNIGKIFPEWDGQDRSSGPDLEETDPSQVDWHVPRSRQEHEDLETWLARHSTGVVSAADLPVDGEGWM